jgi:hypothetical protein
LRLVLGARGLKIAGNFRLVWRGDIKAEKGEIRGWGGEKILRWALCAVTHNVVIDSARDLVLRKNETAVIKKKKACPPHCVTNAVWFANRVWKKRGRSTGPMTVGLSELE